MVTAEIEALLSGNKILYAFVKYICRVWAQPRFDAFHQLRIIAEALWSQPVLQIGKQVVISRKEVRALRRMVKQLPVWKLQQFSIVSSCKRTRITMNPKPDVNIPRLLL
jgi:hypothetical protein